MSTHSSLVGTDLHQPWHYIQESEPGAVGAGRTWFKKSLAKIYYRNDNNTGWIQIIASIPTGDEVPNTTVVPDGSTWADFITIFNAATTVAGIVPTIVLPAGTMNRSEERRVGKE